MVNGLSVKDASILVVDDQPINVKLLVRMLEIEGYHNIETTTDPEEVVDIYKKRPFDLVLLDLKMPKMDGFDVINALYDAMQNELENDYVPILVLTAQTDKASMHRALISGARDFMTKPFDKIELTARISNLIEVRMLHRMKRMQAKLLETEVKARTRALEESQLEIIQSLGRAAEYRDNETGMHIVRLGKMSELLGKELGLNERECDLLREASPMHDLGKIGIPDHVLLKPGKFEPEEWEVMKTHSRIGAEILAGHKTDLLQLAAIIAESHHEKWDGSGYPDGLSGHEIPMAARIVALVDVFDALTSARPYKEAWTVEAAVKYIDENSGKHFDPEVVAAFHKIMPEVVTIKQELVDHPESEETFSHY